MCIWQPNTRFGLTALNDKNGNPTLRGLATSGNPKINGVAIGAAADWH